MSAKQYSLQNERAIVFEKLLQARSQRAVKGIGGAPLCQKKVCLQSAEK